MFSILSEERQYTTYVLCDHYAQSRIEVVPERGGIITRWQHRDWQLLYLDEERFAQPELSVRGGIPILFPICGNLPDDVFVHRGQSYTIKQHGFARSLPWQVVDQDTDGLACLTVMLNSSEQTLAAYPFAFTLVFSYQLLGDTLTLRQHITNRSDEAMPFALGFHPYFSVADKDQLRFEIPATQYYDHRTQPYPLVSFANRFDFTEAEIDAALRPLSANTATVADQQRRLTLRYEDPFSVLVFWTVQGKDFYCLEPWTSPRHALISGDGIVTLDPGHSLETSFSLTVTSLTEEL